MPKRRSQPGAGENPWDRLPSETDPAFEAFTVFLEMGLKRTLRATARRLNKYETNLAKWVTEHHWRDRAAQWDAFATRKRDEGIAAASRKSGLDFFALRDQFIRQGIRSSQRLSKQADNLTRFVEFRLNAAMRADVKAVQDAEALAEASQDAQSAYDDSSVAELLGGRQRDKGKRSKRVAGGPIGGGRDAGDKEDGGGSGQTADAEDIAFADAKLARDWAAVLKDASVIHEKAAALGWAAVNAGVGDKVAERDAAEGKNTDKSSELPADVSASE